MIVLKKAVEMGLMPRILDSDMLDSNISLTTSNEDDWSYSLSSILAPIKIKKYRLPYEIIKCYIHIKMERTIGTI